MIIAAVERPDGSRHRQARQQASQVQLANHPLLTRKCGSNTVSAVAVPLRQCARCLWHMAAMQRPVHGARASPSLTPQWRVQAVWSCCHPRSPASTHCCRRTGLTDGGRTLTLTASTHCCRRGSIVDMLIAPLARFSRRFVRGGEPDHALGRQLYALRRWSRTSVIVYTGSEETALEGRLLRS